MFGDEKTQQSKRETAESEVSLQEVKLAAKQWDQIQAGTKDTFKQLESLGNDALAACRELLQSDPQNQTTKKDEPSKILGHNRLMVNGNFSQQHCVQVQTVLCCLSPLTLH